jgi:hypothetical protein
MRLALRQARLYGYLVELNNMVYIPGGSHPVCTRSFALRLVEGGWANKGRPSIPVNRPRMRCARLSLENALVRMTSPLAPAAYHGALFAVNSLTF